jgi:hypothetical protein
MMYTNSKDGAVLTVAYQGFGSDVYTRRLWELHPADWPYFFWFTKWRIDGACSGSCESSSKGGWNFVFSRITSKRTTQKLNSRGQEYGMYYPSGCIDSQDKGPEKRLTVGAFIAIQVAGCTLHIRSIIAYLTYCEDSNCEGRGSLVPYSCNFALHTGSVS